MRLAELPGIGQRPVAFGLLERVDRLLAVGRQVVGHRLLVGPLQGHDDLRRRFQIVLHGDARLRDRRIDDHFQDVAVFDDHVGEPVGQHAQHVEERLGLVQIGHRSREDLADRIAQLARPVVLGTDDDQFVGRAQRGGQPFVREGAERVAARQQQSQDRRQKYGESFHGRYVFRFSLHFCRTACGRCDPPCAGSGPSAGRFGAAGRAIGRTAPGCFPYKNSEILRNRTDFH